MVHGLVLENGVSFHHDVSVECAEVPLDDEVDDHSGENDDGGPCYWWTFWVQ